MRGWKYSINVRRFLKDEWPSVEDRAIALATHLKASMLFIEIEDVLDDLECQDEEEGFNYVLDQIYDYADEKRILLESMLADKENIS